jgi:hypothetical protein
MVQIIVIIISLLLSTACLGQDNEDSGPGITVSGSNQVNGSYGEIMYHPDKLMEGTGDYLTDYLDFDVGIKSFFTRGTFLVNSPSVGYNPFPEIVNEFFHRRTVGFRSKYMTVEGGHFKTAFGKGLTLNLRENRKTEKNYVLDGVYLMSDLPWFTIQGIAGRSPENSLKEMYLSMVDPNNDLDTISITTKLEDINYRDNVIGVFIESFYPFSEIPALSLLSGTSWGGGLVYFRSDVEKPFDTSLTINKELKKYLFHPRNTTFLPSWFLNLSLGNFNLSYENALMYYNTHDTDMVNFEEEKTNTYYSYSGYLSCGISLGDFYLSGEYKNYFYARKISFEQYAINNPGFNVVKNWVEAPDARQKHGWHLLTKHTLSRPMDDDLGYNASINWSREKTALLTNFSIGGDHLLNDDSTKYKMFTFAEERRYWESYSQWEQNFTDWFNITFGFSIGIMDNIYYPNRLDRTLGSKLLFGPFADKHSFELIVEGQYTTEDFEHPFDTTQNTISQDVYNLFIKPSYSLSPFLSIFLAGEIEPEFYKDYNAAKNDDDTDINYYFSGGVTFSPVENHVLTIEAGSMSGRMECNPPPCVYIQSFKGIKVTLNSIF